MPADPAWTAAGSLAAVEMTSRKASQMASQMALRKASQMALRKASQMALRKAKSRLPMALSAEQERQGKKD